MNDDDFQSVKASGGKGDYFLFLAQVGVLILFTLFTEYDEGVAPGSTVSKDGNSVNLYPCFQDVNVMIFIGFGFLMTYIKAQGQSALAFTWVISIWCIEWGILSQAFFLQMIKGQTFTVIPISLQSLIWGLFGAATAMISYGALLGKCSIQQLLFITFFEMIFWGLNVAICTELIQAVDMGGSIIIHVFGCYFGLAASWWFQPTRASKSPNNLSNHNSEIVALVGSIFLWIYWPSFNGALATQGDQQQRVFCNTNLSIGAGCIGAALMSRIYHGKMEMTIVMNATLAGGVAIGTSSDIWTSPALAMWVGLIAGSWSAFGFEKIGPYLADKFNLQDTCGVNSLHGMPGIIGGIASAFAVVHAQNLSSTAKFSFESGYFPAENKQAARQIYAIIVTLLISIASGNLFGWIAKSSIFSPPNVLFKDDDHFVNVIDRYNDEQRNMGDDVPIEKVQ